MYYFASLNREQINPAKCRYEVMSTKIEIRLAKAQAIHWVSLEYSSEGSVVQKASVSSGKFQLQTLRVTIIDRLVFEGWK